MKHKILRNSDEYACSCGLVWAVNDADPHRHPIATTDRLRNADARSVALEGIARTLREEKPR